MSWGWAAAGGVLGAGVVLGLLGRRKAQQLEQRAEALQDGAAVESALGQQIDELEGDLTDYGRDTAETLVRKSAADHIRTAYKLTPRRMDQLKRLSERF